ncbi:Fe2+-dicitrate sensor, membrane component [Acidovorax sp. CF316]|uniref:FecR family protein n=1 Tax=Acidovorax sp. CF316 TaxID=1144317 RepID=UPI00026BEBF9|nr:FecR domain-containing protein [Acidovorax sp. CF316]EJE51399.1 Fe2+-dicitrate sensor, membrane component [Acidovorax sp. CF316]
MTTDQSSPRHEPGPAERDALAWFVRSRGGLSAGEARELAAWQAQDPAHADAFARWQVDWQQLDALPAQGVARLRAHLAQDLVRERAAAPRPARGWLAGAWAGSATVAASVACVAVVAAGGLLAWQHWQQQPLFEKHIATRTGEQVDVQLPDGSHLRLDTATAIDVALFRQRREVRLPEGQAVFRVQGDAARPFHVLAGPLRITVVGTRFSVRNTPGIPGEAGVRVAVEEGRVRVARADAPAAASGAVVELTAGQQVASDATGRLGPVAAVPPSGIAPWRESRVSFDNTPLAQALAEFGRYGPTQLTVRDPEVAALRLTGTFDPRRLDNFVRVLPQVLPVRMQAPAAQGGEAATTEIVAAP